MLKENSAGMLFSALLLGCLAFTQIAVAQDKFAPCKPVQAATYSNRVHVRCEAAVDGIFLFFAVSTKDDPKFAARVLSVIEAGQLGDKYILVLFDPNDKSGPNFGCLLADCRPIKGAILSEERPGKCSIDNTQKGCPGFCAAGTNNSSDRSCPGFCAAHPDDRQCPAYCSTHDDMSCAGNCSRHPNNPRCDINSDECRNRHLPGCTKN
jgi:hypothetical protein